MEEQQALREHGMLDSWAYYRRFGINIFLYSDLADFLLASFRSPTAWPILLLCLVATVSDQAASRRVDRSATTARWLRWYGSPRYRQVSVVAGILLTVAFVIFYSGWYAERRAGTREVRVVLANGSSVSDPSILLGSSIGFIFLYDPARETVSVHPFENVMTVESPLPRR